MSATTFLSDLLNNTSLDPLSTMDWEAIMPELQAQRLIPFVYARLRRSPAWLTIPPPTQRALSEDFQLHSVHAFEVQEELAAIVAALREVEVPVMLLKGAALGRVVYGSPAERPMGDLDLLIPASDLKRAGKALARRSYQAQELVLLTRWQQRYRAEQRLVCRAPGREGMIAELHWSLFELPYYIDHIPMAEIWHTAGAMPDLPGALLPDSATLLLHGCAHLTLHHSQDQRLLWLLDIDRLLRSNTLDWPAVFERAARWHLRLALGMVLECVETCLGTPVSADVKRELSRLRPAPVEAAMVGVGDDQPDRTRRRIRASWAAMHGWQRWRYVGWLGLHKLASYPEKLAKDGRWRNPNG